MVCTPGDQKCIGADLYRCRQYYDTTYHEYRTEWYLVEMNSPQCVVEPPEPEPEPEPPAPPPPAPVVSLSWIGSIFVFVGDISDWFLSAFQEVSDWIWPFYFLQYPFYGLYRIFQDLLTPIATFWLWAEDIATKIVTVFTSDGILGLINWWFPDLGNVIEWFIGRWNWFISAVGDWWADTKTEVLGWIDMATEGFNALIAAWDEFWRITWPEWMATLEVLRGEVSDFFTKTLPNLLNYLKLENWWNGKLFAVDGLIGSKLAEWFPFYDDLAEFFSDPMEFLLAKLADWFLGKEE